MAATIIQNIAWAFLIAVDTSAFAFLVWLVVA
jgi:hypothetical protein